MWGGWRMDRSKAALRSVRARSIRSSSGDASTAILRPLGSFGISRWKVMEVGSWAGMGRISTLLTDIQAFTLSGRALERVGE